VVVTDTLAGVATVFDRNDDLRGARFVECDLSGAEFREAELSGARMIGVVMIDTEIDGLVRNLTVNGVDVVPLVEAELDRRHPERLLLRSGDPDQLRQGWSWIEEAWAATVERVERLPDAHRRQRVRGEWSVAETLRHLIFVTDSWFSHEVLGIERPYHPFGLPPSFVPNWDEMGIDGDASPSFAEVMAVRAERMAAVRGWLAAATTAELQRRCDHVDDGSWPPPEPRIVADCIHTVLDEEWAHHRFADRDLAILEAGAAGDSVA
jgi:hypothetical protein